MAIVVPSRYSTYGDGSSTEGGRRARYVLAQFRSDAELAWVGSLRSYLGVDELKYKAFRERRAEIRSKRPDLWNQVERGVGQATIVVIDPNPVEGSIRQALAADGAVSGRDFHDKDVIARSAFEIVRGTPVAWLTSELARAIGEPFGDLERFAPEAIQKQIGPRLRDAKVFAARAHAAFDVAALDDSLRSTRDTFRSPMSRVILRELISVQRTFDIESQPSVELLNQASDEIALALEPSFAQGTAVSREPLVREIDSRVLQEMQAADMAAGFARETIDASTLRALGERFERVWINGELIKPTMTRTSDR